MKRFTSLMLMLLVAVTTFAAVDEGLQNKKVSAVGEAATSIDTDTWYLLYNCGRKLYVSEETSSFRMRATSNFTTDELAVYEAGYLFKFEATGNQNEYYIKSGNGLYFTINQGGSAVSNTPVAYTVAQIGDNAGHFYGQMVSDGRVLNGNAAGGTLAGWNTTVPTGIGDNSDYQFLPVTLEDVSIFTVTYKFMYNGDVKYTQETLVKEGDNYPAFTYLPYGVIANVPEGAPTANETVEITCTLDESVLPFEVSTIDGAFGEEVKWYYLTMRSKDVSYDPVTGYALAQNVDEKGVYNLFAFTGNPFDGYSIYNYAAGADKVFWRADATDGGRVSFTNIEETDGNTWILSANGTSGHVFRLNGHANGYMNDHQPQIAIWNSGSGATDGGSTFTFTYVENPDLTILYDVTYNFVYDGKTIATQTAKVVAGEAYPEISVQAPYGVSVVDEDLAFMSGTVTGNVTKEIGLKITKELPFETAASANAITTWYLVRMHTNQPGYIGDIAEDNTVNVAWGKSSDVANENYIWGFVGDVFSGITVVNKGTGKELTSTGSGNVTLTDEGTPFFVARTTETSANATNGFCLRKFDSNNYLNANYNAGKLSHWASTDAGSTFFLSEYEEDVVTVSEAGWATMYLGYQAYIPEGVNVYAVTGVKNGWVTKSQLEGVIPANTGVLLENAGEFTFKRAAKDVNALEGNLMNGSVEDTYVEGTAYVLANRAETGVGMYKAELNKDAEGNEGTTHFLNNAGKAYMVLPAASETVAFYGLDWDGTTGVENVVVENEVKTIYDLTGRRVENISAPGIYVVNGKKVLVK